MRNSNLGSNVPQTMSILGAKNTNIVMSKQTTQPLQEAPKLHYQNSKSISQVRLCSDMTLCLFLIK